MLKLKWTSLPEGNGQSTRDRELFCDVYESPNPNRKGIIVSGRRIPIQIPGTQVQGQTASFRTYFEGSMDDAKLAAEFMMGELNEVFGRGKCAIGQAGVHEFELKPFYDLDPDGRRSVGVKSACRHCGEDEKKE